MKTACALLLCSISAWLSACSSSSPGTCSARYEQDACGTDCSQAGTAVRFRVDRLASDFFAAPWPSDARRLDNGAPDLAGFPNPANSSMLTDYLATIEAETRGFGTNAAIYFTFDGALDRDSLPADAAATVTANASAFLVDISDGPGRGERFPLIVRFFAEERQFTPANTLVLRPVLGFPLRQGTTYAAVITSRVRDAGGAHLGAGAFFERSKFAAPPQDAVEAAWWQALHPAYAALQDLAGLCPKDVIALTVFTTQDVLGEMDAVAAFVAAEPAPQAHDWNDLGAKDDLYRLEAWYENLEFQSGEPPDYDGGGGFLFDAQGQALVQRRLDIPLTLAVPKGQMPAAGWPLVIYAHGTGGSRNGFLSAKDDTGDKLARLGIASMSIDQPLHGDRNPWGRDENIITFNPYNILAMRDNFRQGGADLLVLRRLISTLTVPAAASPTAAEVRFDDAKVAFMGHSQGSLNGPNFLATSPDTLGAVFSGSGGSLGPALLGKVEPIDIPALIIMAMGLVPSEFDLDHPVIAIFQTFAEKADPLNYTRRFIREPAAGAASKSVFVSQGLLDEYALPEQAAAFAGAIGCSPVEPFSMGFSALSLRDLDPLDAPVSGNVTAGDGQARTAVIVQYPDDGHFAVFDNPRAERQHLGFLESLLLEGLPTVVE